MTSINPQPAPQTRPGRLRLDEVVLRFPHVWEPQAYSPEAAPVYSAALLVVTDSPQHQLIRRTLQAVAEHAWREQWTARVASIKAADNLAFRDGVRKPEYSGFEGHWFLSARCAATKPPLLIGGDRRPITASHGLLVDGCVVNASVDIWAQPARNRINCELRGLQYVSAGDPSVGVRPASVDEFEEIAAEYGPEAAGSESRGSGGSDIDGLL